MSIGPVPTPSESALPNFIVLLGGVAALIGLYILQRRFFADDEEFIAEWPEDRTEEDFVFIDTGDDFEEMVRFNLLEVPDELEPGSVAHSSYVESLADDMSAAFAQTGGSDNYWGALMSRVTRTLIRGMTQSGKTCTPVDLAAACSSQDNLEQFADWMNEERVHFIRETADRIKEKEDADLEPLAGRMDNVVHNATLRTMLSTREPTIRIQDIVDDGKIAVLRLDPSLGETEKNFITTPLVRRFYNAKKMSENEDPFFCVWDEFDKAVTRESNVDEMLSEAGGYGLWFVLACQAPSYQLPESLTNAVESQIETFVSFGTSGQDAKYIAGQHTIDDSDLSNLSRYSMYMRTHDDNDDFTHSYRVNTFPPVREVRSEVGNAALMSDTDVLDLKRRSVEQYGEIPESPEEIKDESHFFGTPSRQEAESTTLTPWQQSRVCKAIYDEALRQGSDDGFVFLNDVPERLDDYLYDVDVSTPSKVSSALDYLSAREIEREDRGGKLYVRCTEQGKQAIFSGGNSLADDDESVQENNGGEGHKQLLRDAYDPLMDTGLLVDIPQQDGSDMPDATANLDDALQLGDSASAREIANRVAEFEEKEPVLTQLTDLNNVSIEAEKATGSTKQGQTVKNLASAVNDGEQCLFIARESIAPNVWKTLAEEPLGAHENHKPDGETRFYNLHPLSIDDEQIYRDGAREDVWVRNERTGKYILRDSSGEEHARFPNVESIFTDADRYPSVDPGATENLRTVKTPVIPEHIFDDGELPDHGDGWHILVVPSDGDSLQVYIDGMTVPLESLGADGTGDDDPEEDEETGTLDGLLETLD
ncbi:hypothetical protein [Natrinema sp. SYSU A 869]|uniref:hypothetical protein n=1 Tax=Natrinema sp. SYSU A 869 TaxID=2871694 RepID=UPI001CA3DE23|nr:hypothetical protein [Natrinema sp. SYSU A 869]